MLSVLVAVYVRRQQIGSLVLTVGVSGGVFSGTALAGARPTASGAGKVMA